MKVLRRYSTYCQEANRLSIVFFVVDVGRGALFGVKEWLKEDVGMSPHEKEREQKGSHPRTESHPTPSLHFSFSL